MAKITIQGITRNLNWQPVNDSSPKSYYYLSFLIEKRDEETGDIVELTPVEMHNVDTLRNIANDGDPIEVEGELDKNNLLQAQVIKNLRTEAVLKKNKKSLGCLVIVLTGALFIALATSIFGSVTFWPIISKLLAGKSFSEAIEPSVTLCEYYQVEEGMSYEEIEQIFGSSGTESSSNISQNSSEVTYSWYYPTNKLVSITFDARKKAIRISNYYKPDLNFIPFVSINPNEDSCFPNAPENSSDESSYTSPNTNTLPNSPNTSDVTEPPSPSPSPPECSIATLTNNLDNAQQSKTLLESRMSSLGKEIDELSNDRDSRRTKSNAIRAELDEIQEQIAEYGNSINSLETELSVEEETLTRVRNLFEEGALASEQLSRQEALMSSLAMRIKTNEAQMLSQENLVTEKRRDLNEINDRISLTEAEIEGKRNDRENVRNELNDVEDQIESLSASLEDC